MDPLRDLIQGRLDELAAVEGRRLTVRAAARRCGMKPSTWYHHFGGQLPRGRQHQQLTDEQLHQISSGLGIPLAKLQAAAIVAAGYVIDVRRFDLSVIRSVLLADMPEDERRRQQERAQDLADSADSKESNLNV